MHLFLQFYVSYIISTVSYINLQVTSNTIFPTYRAVTVRYSCIHPGLNILFPYCNNCCSIFISKKCSSDSNVQLCINCIAGAMPVWSVTSGTELTLWCWKGDASPTELLHASHTWATLHLLSYRLQSTELVAPCWSKLKPLSPYTKLSLWSFLECRGECPGCPAASGQTTTGMNIYADAGTSRVLK